MQQLTSHAVKLAALLLIETNNQTTSLEVKELLRNIGYNATQSKVSDLLLLAAIDLPLAHTSNGTYNVYSLPNPQNVVDSDSDSDSDDTTSTQTSQVGRYTNHKGQVIYGYSNLNDIDDTDSHNAWCVSAPSEVDTTLFFNGIHNRDDVRYAFARMTNVHFHKTRSHRIKV